MVTRGIAKKTKEELVDHGCWIFTLDQPGGKIKECFSYSDSSLLFQSASLKTYRFMLIDGSASLILDFY
jgi:hypothetical protein